MESRTARRAGGSPDPVALHGLDLLRPVQHVQVVEQPVGVGGDPHHPLPQPLPEHREVAAFAAAVGGDLFVGQHGAQARTPVHHRFGLVHQAVPVDHVGALARRQLDPGPAVVQLTCTGIEFGDQLGDRAGLAGGGVEPGVVDLQEDPLRPLVELGVGGGEAAAAVVAETQPAQLAPEVDDVGLGAGAGMGAGLHRILLGGQTERIETQRVQHITAQSSGSSGRRRRWRCSPAGGRRAGPRPTGTETCPARTSCRRGPAAPSVGASEPTGLGTLNVPEPGPVVLPGLFDAAGQVRGVAVPRRVGVSDGPRRSGSRSRPTGYKGGLRATRRPPTVSVGLQTDQGFIPARVRVVPVLVAAA